MSTADREVRERDPQRLVERDADTHGDHRCRQQLHACERGARPPQHHADTEQRGHDGAWLDVLQRFGQRANRGRARRLDERHIPFVVAVIAERMRQLFENQRQAYARQHAFKDRRRDVVGHIAGADTAEQ